MEICDICDKHRDDGLDQGWRRIEYDSTLVGMTDDPRDFLVCSWECAYELCKKYKEAE